MQYHHRHRRAVIIIVIRFIAAVAAAVIIVAAIEVAATSASSSSLSSPASFITVVPSITSSTKPSSSRFTRRHHCRHCHCRKNNPFLGRTATTTITLSSRMNSEQLPPKHYTTTTAAAAAATPPSKQQQQRQQQHRLSSSSSSPTSVIMTTTTTTTTSTLSASSSSSSSSSDNQSAASSLKKNPRTCILQVGVCAGRLCELAASWPLVPSNDNDNGTETTLTQQQQTDLVTCLAQLTVALYEVSQSLNLHMEQSIRNKLRLNEIKYPVEHCKGKAGKYTEYSHLTGITKTNQSTMTTTKQKQNQPEKQKSNENQDNVDRDRIIHTIQSWLEFVTVFPSLAMEIEQFAYDRQWNKFHTPRNIVLALLGEVGELAEILQFRMDMDMDMDTMDNMNLDDVLPIETLDKLSQEIADVTIYMIRLTTVCNVVVPLRDELLLQQSLD